MATYKSHSLYILSGPSCVGKTPLYKSLQRFYPELAGKLQALVLYNSREPRPGEKEGIDYYFRSEEQIRELGNKPSFIVMDVRGDTQGLDIDELQKQLEQEDVLFEGNPFVGECLLTEAALAEISKASIFMSPLSKEELLYLKASNADLTALVTDIMRRKLLRRTRKQKGELSLADLENIEKRAGSAFSELEKAHLFDYVLPNHDGEDSDNWDAFYYPLGDARLALLDLDRLLNGEQPTHCEQWQAHLLEKTS